MNSCCFTGHRSIPSEYLDTITEAIQAEVRAAIADGFDHFYCGFAEGGDLVFAQAVAHHINAGVPIHLHAALPSRARERALLNNPAASALLSLCDEVYLASEKGHAGIYAQRNRYMVEHCQRVIALYDGRETGGTAATILLARQLNRCLRLINPTAPQ